MRATTASFQFFVLAGLAFSLGASCSQSTSAGDKSAVATSTSDKPAVAIVNGDAITEDDLDIGGQLIQLEQEAYQVRIKALEKAIAQRLLEAEARKQSLTVEELLEQEAYGGVADPTPEEVAEAYARNRRSFRKPLEEIREQVREALKYRGREGARKEYVDGLAAKARVEVLLKPPRLPVDLENARRRGPAEARVTVVEYSDFQCPYCKRMQPVMRELMAKYEGDLSWVFKDLPLKRIHPGAVYAAEAARCAGEQGKFWEYRDALFEVPRVTDEVHPEIVGSLELDQDSFDECTVSGRHRGAVEADSLEAQKLGIRGTPAFIINGILLSGARPMEEFTRVIDAELAAKRER